MFFLVHFLTDYELFSCFGWFKPNTQWTNARMKCKNKLKQKKERRKHNSKKSSKYTTYCKQIGLPFWELNEASRFGYKWVERRSNERNKIKSKILSSFFLSALKHRSCSDKNQHCGWNERKNFIESEEEKEKTTFKTHNRCSVVSYWVFPSEIFAPVFLPNLFLFSYE